MFSTWALLLEKKVGEGTRGMREEGYHEFCWHVSIYSTSHRLHNDVQPFPAIAIFLFYLDMQAWALLTGRDCIVSDTKVTVKARGPLVKTYEDYSVHSLFQMVRDGKFTFMSFENYIFSRTYGQYVLT